METKNVSEEVETEAATKEQVNLSLEDLSVLASIVKLAQSRGAFQVEEMSQVGAVYDKLNFFLTKAAEAQKAADESEKESKSSK
jgi:hypothetical protein